MRPSRRNIAYGLILFAVNLYVCWKVFGLEYSQFMKSIEGAYIAISRHILLSWRHLEWWPAWYNGIPFNHSYPPLLHMLVALAAAILRVSVARAHHIVTGLFYCAGPVCAYALAARLSRRYFASFCAALLYTVLSPSGLLIHTVALDMEHPLRPRRLGTLLAYGDGPHLSGLAIMPLALLFLDLALVKRRPVYYVLSALSMVAVVYINWLSAFALAVLVICYLAAGQPWRNWLIAAAIGSGAYLFAVPWATPSLIRTIQFNAQTIGGDFRNASATLLHTAPFALAALLLIKFALHRLRVPGWLQAFSLFAAVMAWIALGFYWFGVAVVPQPDRYHLEMDLGLVFALTMGAALLFERSPQRVQQAAVILLLLFCARQLYRGHRYARGMVQNIDIAKTIEYQSARWFDGHMRGIRIMTSGTIEFWLNAFTDTPQTGGGFENGDINYVDRIAHYQIVSGAGEQPSSIEFSLLWLKAFGVQAIEAGGPKTRDFYHTMSHGERFQGALPELWRDGDDAIYRVPQRNGSLAHVVYRANLVTRTPVSGVDVAELRNYVAALDDPIRHEAQFLWRTPDAAEVFADMSPDQLVSVQVNYHPGWHATVNGSTRRVFADGLGFLVIEPRCAGECRIELNYDGGLEMRIATWLSRCTLVGALIWIWISRRKQLLVS